MPKPDLLLYAALVHAGALEVEIAERVIHSYGLPREYDYPVPIDLESALSEVCGIIHGQEDDEAVDELLSPHADHEMVFELEEDESEVTHSSTPPSWWIDAFYEWAQLGNDG